jgi:transposase-like protein
MATFEIPCDYCGRSLIRRVVKSAYFCGFQCKAEWQKRNNKPVTEEWLRDAYVNQKMDCTQIAHMVKRDPKSVWNWLKAFGIPTRPRGSNVGQLPKDGSPFRGKHHTTELRGQIRARALADGRVPYLKNGQHWLKESGSHPPSWRGGITPERQAFYSTQEWKAAVVGVWKRADAKCEKCGLDHRTLIRGTVRFDIHHIDSFQIVARRAEVDNLMLVCYPCHKWIHSKRNRKGKYLGKGN